MRAPENSTTFANADSIDLPVYPEEGVESSGKNDTGSLLWEYHKLNTINGIPVDSGATGLKIDDESVLIEAFALKRTPKIEMLSLGLDNAEGLARYNEVLDMAYAGKAAILDETRNYDPEKHCYVVLLRYDLISFALNPRFDYLKTE